MIEHEGSHGTTASRAQGIEAVGFKKGKSGIWGPAVYFFHRDPNGTEFAFNWFCFERRMGRYELDGDDRCVILHACIATDERNFFDLLDPNVLSLYQALEDELRGRAKYTEDEKNHIRDKWIRDFERRNGTTIKVFNSTIPVPRKEFKPDKAALCLVVRDEGCIRRPYTLEAYHE